MTAKHLLSELLAVIHGDGGYYEGEHGTEKATRDAIKKVLKLKTATAELTEIVEVVLSDVKSMLIEDSESRAMQAHAEAIMNRARRETWWHGDRR